MPGHSQHKTELPGSHFSEPSLPSHVFTLLFSSLKMAMCLQNNHAWRIKWGKMLHRVYLQEGDWLKWPVSGDQGKVVGHKLFLSYQILWWYDQASKNLFYFIFWKEKNSHFIYVARRSVMNRIVISWVQTKFETAAGETNGWPQSLLMDFKWSFKVYFFNVTKSQLYVHPKSFYFYKIPKELT